MRDPDKITPIILAIVIVCFVLGIILNLQRSFG